MILRHELWISARQSAVAATCWLFAAALAFVVFFAVVLLVFRFVDPPTSAVMVRNQVSGATVRQTWMPLERISPNIVYAVISSEDARFCRHNGIDWTEASRALRSASANGIDKARGASTITMQVAKNLFLWTDRSLLRKGLEVAITPMIELFWPKRRIIEVYLNIAQWGPGVFGIAEAAKLHFDHPASDLSATEASLLTASLPAPSVRRPGRATRFTRRIAARIRRRMRQGSVEVGCIYEPGTARPYQ